MTESDENYPPFDGTLRKTPLPHDAAVEKIANARFDRELGRSDDEVRWRYVRESFFELRRRLWIWMRALPCRIWWHSPGESHTGMKVCRRCGAWRE